MSVRRLDPEEFDWTSGAGGAAEVRRVLTEATEHDRREALNEAAQLVLRNHGLDTAFLLLDEDADGARGFAYVHGLSGGARPELDLVVTPRSRGRGVGAALAREVLTVLDGIPVTAWSHGDHPAAARIAARVEFAAARSLWVMRRRSDLPLPDVPTPRGIRVRAFEHGDVPELLRVNGAAFADHPEQAGLDAAGFEERRAEAWFDPAGLLVGERDDGGTLAGFHWTKRHPDGTGEVYVIGVHPEAQGTGLGRALLVAGLRHLVGQGAAEVILFVEADNTSAIGLYESFGFTHAPEDTDVMYAPR